MSHNDTETDSCREEESSENIADVSRRAVLSSLGTGAATLGLGGAAGTAAAEDPGDSPAASFAEEMGDATSATGSGAWSDASVWDSGRPGEEADARIGPDASVTIESETEPIKTLVVEGDLSFATDVDSHLRAETIITTPGSSLEIGTEDEPIQPDAEARITIVHHEDISEKDYDPERISKGIITLGHLEIHGAEKTSWDELAKAPTAGDTTVELASAPTNWTEGDEIVIPGLDPSSNEDDERTIASVSGATVELDEPLEYDHVPPENNLDVELTAYALNRTRNVRFESAVKETDVTKEARINRQGHLMMMQPAQSISYLEVDHFGRTNKNFFMDDLHYGGVHKRGRGVKEASEPNITARYGLHFHKTGVGEEPHEVTGVVVQHSPGWGVVNHSSHANVRDSITYQVFGAGFVVEAGKERGSFERCFALRSEGSKSKGRLYNDRMTDGYHEEVDFGHEGEGFWLQGPAVAVNDCVAAGHDSYAIALWNVSLDGKMPAGLAKEDGLVDRDGAIDPHNLPLKSFSNNTVFASSGGFDYGKSLPIGESVVETFTVYNIGPTIDNQYRNYPAVSNYVIGAYGNSCISERYAKHLRVENPQFCNVDGQSGDGPDGYNGHGIRRNYDTHDPVGVYGGVMEGLNVGVQVAIHAENEDVEGVRFHDNRVDINHPKGTVDGSSVAHLDIYPGTSVGFWWHVEVNAKPADSEFEEGTGLHTFTVPGEYEYEWARENKTGTITVSEDPEAELPLATFEYQSGASAGESITFDASQSTPSDSITSYEWDFGDGTTGSGKTVEYSYDTGGFYDVTLTVTDDAGYTNETTTQVGVGTHEIHIEGLDDQESNYEFSVSGPLQKGKHATGQDDVEGNTVSGEIGGGTDNYHYVGEITSWSLEKDIPVRITIDGEEVDQSTLGTVGFATTDEGELTVSFDASGSSSSITSYEWDFGDGSTATGQTVEHAFDKPGHYDVTLTVTDDSGQSNQATRELGVGETHEILIDGTRRAARSYEFSVSGTVEGGDNTDGSTASGAIWAASDSYRYGGEITSWYMEKNEENPITIFIDDEEVDPSTLGQSGDPGDPGTDADKSVTVAPNGNHAFAPAELTVEPGTTVAFEWDAGGHTVTVDSQPQEASWSGVDSTQSEGHTITHTFDVEGTYEYYCRPHQSHMQGTITVTDEQDQSAYGRDSPWPLPGRVQAEDFDAGGPDAAYADESTGNIGGEYRDTQVDIQQMPNSEDNYNLGWMHQGEWLEYTVDVQSGGTYDLTLNVASPQSGTVELEVSIGDTAAVPVTVPQTGDWNNYETVTVSDIQLAAGEQVLRIDVVNTGGNEYGCDIDWFEVTENEQESIPQALDADDDGIIEDKEILNGLSHWKSGEPVPNTGGQTVTDEAVLELVKLWKEETDVMGGD